MSNQSAVIRPPDISHDSPTIASISLPAIAHNLAELRRLLEPNYEILAIVKADGYGHGALPVARTLFKLGIRRFGVSTVQEGAFLRENGVEGSIILLGGIFPWHFSYLIQYNLIPVISDEETAFALAEHLKDHPTPYSVHIKIDTGMHRLGFSPESVSHILEAPLFRQACFIEGIMTHLADADNPNHEFSELQLDCFQKVVRDIQLRGLTIPFVHAANTAGIVLHPSSHFNLVRPGLMLYGFAPKPPPPHALDLLPAMRLTTKIVQVRKIDSGEPVSYKGTYKTRRPSRIAVLPIGYAHGYSRRLSNRGFVLAGNQRVPIVGQICMDMMLLDITDTPQVRPGDEVVLVGKQGQEEISVGELADWQETIPYEVLCNIGPRVTRRYEPFVEPETNPQ